MQPIYWGRYGPIEKPYVRELSRSKLVAEIWGSKLPFFVIWSLFFHLWFFGWKISKFTPSIDAIKENIWNFFQFFVHILRQKRSLKRKKRDFNTFEVVQYAILGVSRDKFQHIIAQIIGFTERNNWNFLHNFSLIPFFRNAAWLEVKKTRFRTSKNVSKQGT